MGRQPTGKPTSFDIAYREDVRAGEDLLLNLCIMIAGARAYYVDEPLYIYTTPVGATSRTHRAPSIDGDLLPRH